MMRNFSNSKFCLALVLFLLLASLMVSGSKDSEQGKAEAETNIVLNEIDNVTDVTKVNSLVLSAQTESLNEVDPEPIKLFYIPEIPLDRELQEYTYDLCIEKNVDYELVLAVMTRESQFQIDATGYNHNGTQDHGIMQINDRTKEHFYQILNINDIYDPYQNILVGLTLLSDVIGKYGEYDGLMAYAAGESGMKELKKEKVISKYHQRILDGVQVAFDKRDEIKLMEKVK